MNNDFVLPDSNVIVDPITEQECESLGNNTGLDINDGETTCQALKTKLLPLLSQIIGDISSGSMVIYANDDSKCDDQDTSPTLASMLSRIYRVSQAFACILCQYDPTLSNMLMAGTYPQVLMGGENYPSWVTPDSAPTEGSNNLVTSNGIYTAIQNAIISVWHMWDEGDDGSFEYYVTDVQDLPTNGNTNGDYALVYDPATYSNMIYEWDGSAWVLSKTVLPADMEDFAVVHINKGDWADKGLYWFDTGWNLLDADLGDLESRVAALEASMAHTVQALDTTTTYKLGVVATASQASSVPSEAGVTKIVFISGS